MSPLKASECGLLQNISSCGEVLASPTLTAWQFSKGISAFFLLNRWNSLHSFIAHIVSLPYLWYYIKIWSLVNGFNDFFKVTFLDTSGQRIAEREAAVTQSTCFYNQFLIIRIHSRVGSILYLQLYTQFLIHRIYCFWWSLLLLVDGSDWRHVRVMYSSVM